jgi:hypothetical protein
MTTLLTLAAIIGIIGMYFLIELQQQYKKMKREDKLPEIPGFRSVYPDEQLTEAEWHKHIRDASYSIASFNGSISKRV